MLLGPLQVALTVLDIFSEDIKVPRKKSSGRNNYIGKVKKMIFRIFENQLSNN